MTPNESLHLLMWYQQDWDITTTFIASLLSAEGHSLPDGCSFVVGEKYPHPPPSGRAGRKNIPPSPMPELTTIYPGAGEGRHQKLAVACQSCTAQRNATNQRGGEKQPMARSSRWPFIRRMAWDRDRKARAVCHICGEPIDYFVPPSSTPNSYEPDHLVPVHMRPDLELDLNNIAASHRRCNRQRGDGTNGTNVIGMRSRRW